nr:MAG TPA: hypothetical protein [Crassvirales sp.]
MKKYAVQKIDNGQVIDYFVSTKMILSVELKHISMIWRMTSLSILILPQVVMLIVTGMKE